MASSGVKYSELVKLDDKKSVPVNEKIIDVMSCETRTDLGYGIKIKFKIAKSLYSFYKVNSYDTATNTITTDAPDGTYLLNYYDATNDQMQVQQVVVNGGQANIDPNNFGIFEKQSFKTKLRKITSDNLIQFDSDISSSLAAGDYIALGNSYFGKVANISGVVASDTVSIDAALFMTYDDGMPVWKQVSMGALGTTDASKLRLVLKDTSAMSYCRVLYREQSGTSFTDFARVYFQDFKIPDLVGDGSGVQTGIYWASFTIETDKEWDNGRALSFVYQAEDAKFPNPNYDGQSDVKNFNTTPSIPKIEKVEWDNINLKVKIYFNNITENGKNPAFAAATTKKYKIYLWNTTNIQITNLTPITSKWVRVGFLSDENGNKISVYDKLSGNIWIEEANGDGVDIYEDARRTKSLQVDYAGLTMSQLVAVKKSGSTPFKTETAQPDDGSKEISVGQVGTYLVEMEAEY